MKYSHICFCLSLALALLGGAAQSALAQPLKSKPPETQILGREIPDGANSYWDLFHQRIEAQNARYAEEHPDWPKGEPAPRHVTKNALKDMSGKNLLEALREGVELTREAYKDAPEAELALHMSLAIEGVLEYFPLIETNPKGHMNLYYVVSSVNSDPLYRSYLIKRCHPSDLPDTLFSLYLQDKFKENLAETLGRFKNIIVSPNDNPAVVEDTLAAYQSLIFNKVTDELKADREAQRFATQNSLEINPSLLKKMPESALSQETREHIYATLGMLDEVLTGLPNQFAENSTRPDTLKTLMLDFIENALKEYNLPSAQTHIDFLAAQGRVFAIPEAPVTPAAKAAPEVPAAAAE